MIENLKKSFLKIAYTPEKGLSELVWARIQKRNKRIAYIKVMIFSLVGIASIAGLVPAIKILSSDLTQSGFYEYLSLAFSNGTIVTYWREITLSLLESLPSISIILSLSLIFILFISMKYIAEQFSKVNMSLSF